MRPWHSAGDGSSDPKLRVALVLERFNPRAGGLECWTSSFAEALLARGYEVHVVASEFAPAGPSVARHYFARKPSPLRQAQGIATAVRQLEVDVVHDMGYGWSGDVFHPHASSRVLNLRREVAAMPLAARLRRFFSPGFRYRRRELRATERRQMKAAKYVIAVSQMVKRELTETYGFAADRIRVVPNGVDTVRFSPAQRAAHRNESRGALGFSDEIVFLAVAHNFPLKGVDTTLAALALLREDKRKARLVVAGNGDIAEYRHRAARLGVSELISFLGNVDAIERIYAAADILVHPTLHDACSLATLEAVAAGLPVITTCADGAGERLRAGDEVLIIARPRDVRELAEAMEALLDRDRRLAMSIAAQRVRPELAFDRNVARVIEIYETVLEQRLQS
ncbi:MAG: glycosyltransferase family 4 protein [Candidatus Binataceae bacterium]